MNDKGQQFYEYLKSINIEVPASYEEFQSAMQDQNTADQFYEFVKSQNVEVPETSAEFSSVFTSSGGAEMGFTQGSEEPQNPSTTQSEEPQPKPKVESPMQSKNSKEDLKAGGMVGGVAKAAEQVVNKASQAEKPVTKGWGSYEVDAENQDTAKVEVSIDASKYNTKPEYKPRENSPELKPIGNIPPATDGTPIKGESGKQYKLRTDYPDFVPIGKIPQPQTKKDTFSMASRPGFSPTPIKPNQARPAEVKPTEETPQKMSGGASGTWEEAKENTMSTFINDLAKNGIGLAEEAKNKLSAAMDEMTSTVSNTSSEIARNIENAPSYLKRQAVKMGILDADMAEDIPFQEVVIPQSVSSDTVKTDTIPSFTQQMGVVKETHYKDVGAPLSSHRNQFNASNGFTYNAIPSIGNTEAPQKLEGNLGVAHFFIMDANDARPEGSKDIFSVSQEELKSQSDLYKSGKDYSRKPEDSYIPVFTKPTPTTLTVSYKKKSDITEDDNVVQNLAQVKASEIDWNKETTEDQYSKGIKVVAKKDGSPIPALPVYDGLKNSGNRYGRFAGSGVVFLYEKDGKTYAEDFSGSVNNIKLEIERIKKDYGVPEESITLGFFDAGSYSAKPAANNKGVLDRSQWSDYNTKAYSGSGIAIPSQRPKRQVAAPYAATQIPYL